MINNYLNLKKKIIIYKIEAYIFTVLYKKKDQDFENVVFNNI